MQEVLTTGQAAALCSVTPDAVLKWVKAGKIPANRTPGGHYRIRRSDLPAIIESAEEEPSVKEGRDRPFQYCWEYNVKSGEIHEECQRCIVYRSRARRCYEMSRLPASTGHAGLFCTDSCEECQYYELVRWQRPNVLVVTDQAWQRAALESKEESRDYNLRFTDCEYHCSMLIEKYRPDYIILDCSMGTERARQFAGDISADPRIPYVRVVLVGDSHEFPVECDKEVFAIIERPFTAEVLEEFMTWSTRRL